jgi:hypothetical protein
MKLQKEQRKRIREQSKEVAAYMEKPQKYQVLWTCPHCGNEHTWWWKEKWEAHDDGVVEMRCDRCDKTTKCQGDGYGFYEPIVGIEEKWPGVGPNFESVLDELRNSRKVHFSLINKLLDRTDDLDSLNTDVHNYVRGLEDKVNDLSSDLYGAINALGKRLSEIETGEIFDNLSRRMTTAEIAIMNLEDGIGVNTYSDRRKPKEQPCAFDIIDGPKQPFYERFREGCEFTKETLSGETIAKMLRFVAVEVERMTERDMGGSFTISNLKVGEKLREMADEAALAEDEN